MDNLSQFTLPETRSVCRRLAQGEVQGSQQGKCSKFLGIPYGKPAADLLGFRPPVLASAWQGSHSAHAYGHACPQANDDLPAWQFAGPHSTDCLNLNIWAPAQAKPGDALPVMVWLHGGSFLSGSANLALYDGHQLASEQQLVIVSINHRLNIFGYLHLAALDACHAQIANLGQQDILLALEWIAKNIHEFGGNPDNITLFGESGGGGKICALMMMPAATGLFHKAIIQSGTFCRMLSLIQARERAETALSLLGIDKSLFGTQDLLDQLAHLQTDQLLIAVEELAQQYGHTAFWPVDDGVILNSQNLFAAPVPLLIGTTRDEAAYFLEPQQLKQDIRTVDNYTQMLRKSLKPFSLGADDAQQAIDMALRAHASKAGNLTQDLTDLLFWLPAMALADQNSQHTATYMYRFDWTFSCFGGHYAIHAADIPFVFGCLDYPQPAWDLQDLPSIRYLDDLKSERFTLALRVRQAWASFARNGAPSFYKEISWPRYTEKNRHTMIFDKTCQVEQDPDSARRHRWLDALLHQLL